ncbi:MAG TPA: DNA-binding response regulator [Microscillaceae bacterium]|jgi:two-component system alkaline phosphatase synthesis response regulator PhoP|nr:DNA-binding response regulator [Microscillaceae bacterium]
MQTRKSHKILVVDDEQDVLEMLKYNFEKEGYEVRTATNGLEAIQIAKTYVPELILMDIMMPKMDGVEASQRLREMPEIANTYIIFLTARVEEYSEVAAFSVGADDYITKPIKPRALLSRVEAFFRREQKRNKQDTRIEAGDLVIDKNSYSVFKGENPINLPKKEFELLYYLATNPDKVLTREDLLQHIWGDIYVLSRTVDVHIRKVREKIGEGYIQTIKGVGYKFKLD